MHSNDSPRNNTEHILSFVSILMSEWKIWLPASVFALFAASILMSGWPEGLLPNIAYPFTLVGDSQFTAWVTQRLMEGWVFNNPRSGYPFGSSFLDFPGSDAGDFLFLKMLGLMTGKYYAATNLFFLLGFSIVTAATYITLRTLHLKPCLSIAGGLIFAFAPFHFLRLEHLFFTWYFVVPIFFYIGFKMFYLRPIGNYLLAFKKPFLAWGLCLIALSSFGIYYTLFGAIVIFVSSLVGSIRSGRFTNILIGLIATGALTLGIAINTAPNIFYSAHLNKNSEVAIRGIHEAEFYGFKITQLILPIKSHHIQKFAELTNTYNSSTPLVNENTSATLGILGVLGLLIMSACLVTSAAGQRVDSRLALLSLLSLVLLLFGTIGGLGSLFAIFISPSIRGWNRISIFISFAAISIFLITLQLLLEKYSGLIKWRTSLPLIATIVTLFGFYDQTNWACKPCNNNVRNSFNMSRDFIRGIEVALPPGSAVYQLPYIPFPETPLLNGLGPYEPLTGFSDSDNLLWSSGGMKGRPGDLFYRALSKEPIETQLEVIRKLGFDGIYVDRRGYSDHGDHVISELSKLIGAPTLERTDKLVVFFKIRPSSGEKVSNLTFDQIITKSEFDPDFIRNGYIANIENGIDFRVEGYPSFLRNVSGVDGRESGGRWTNANLYPFAKITFKAALPKKFKLELQGLAYGPNAELPTIIRVGSELKKITLTGDAKTYELQFSNSDDVKTIEIEPPKPTSPKDLNSLSSDTRKIGIRLISLKITAI